MQEYMPAEAPQVRVLPAAVRAGPAVTARLAMLLGVKVNCHWSNARLLPEGMLADTLKLEDPVLPGTEDRVKDVCAKALAVSSAAITLIRQNKVFVRKRPDCIQGGLYQYEMTQASHLCVLCRSI